MSILNKNFIPISIVSLLVPITSHGMSIEHSPKESYEIIINPDIGITDHQTINIRNNKDWNIPSYPETSVVYYRWYWEELEPEKGKYNFKLIDDTINEAKKLNKKIVIRFMTLAGLNETYYEDSPRAGKKILGIPCWLKQQIDPKSKNGCQNDNSFVVNYTDPKFKKSLQNFITAMGNRYNNNTNILRLDVGLIGTWGEWHLGTFYDNSKSTLKDLGYTNKDLIPYIQMMKQAFPNKSLIIDLGTTNDSFTGYATRNGLGWRADCFGDWSQGWNHMQQAYPETFNHILKNKRNGNNETDPYFLTRWKKAPVDFEVCDTMKEWGNQPNIYTEKKVKQTFDRALSLHVSLMNLKSDPIPKKYQKILNQFLTKIGYRFVLEHIKITSDFQKNTPITISSQWKNVGVAPSYNNYPITWRIVNSKGDVITYYDTKNDITNWLPSENLNDTAPIYNQKNTFTLPKTIKAGKYLLEVGLVKPGTHEAVIGLAIENDNKNRWYQLQEFNIK
ncbi:TPA: DUF4832 domain-containing protein [Photobacterium damselae]